MGFKKKILNGSMVKLIFKGYEKLLLSYHVLRIFSFFFELIFLEDFLYIVTKCLGAAAYSVKSHEVDANLCTFKKLPSDYTNLTYVIARSQ